VLVSGLGYIGLLCLKLVVVQGTRPSSSKLLTAESGEAARRFDAYATVDLGSQRLQETINELAKGQTL
jgi:hypothetical protein